MSLKKNEPLLDLLSKDAADDRAIERLMTPGLKNDKFRKLMLQLNTRAKEERIVFDKMNEACKEITSKLKDKKKPIINPCFDEVSEKPAQQLNKLKVLKIKEKRNKIELEKKKMHTFNLYKHDFLAQHKLE